MKRKRDEPWPEEFTRLKNIHRCVCMVCDLLQDRSRVADHIRRIVDSQLKTTVPNEDYLALLKVLLEDEITYDYGLPLPGDSGDFDEEQVIFEFNDSKPKKNRPARQKLIERRIERFQQVVDSYLEDGGTMDLLLRDSERFKPKPAVRVIPDTEKTTAAVGKKDWDDVFEYFTTKHEIVENGMMDVHGKQAEYKNDECLSLSNQLVDALKNGGIKNLYSHQVEAIDSLLNQHQSVVISTPTSSGKSLIYQIPAIESILKDENATALFIFPTKALAQDQKRAFNALLDEADLRGEIFVDTYDGDTEFSERERIRNTANVIFTNPDMLHTSILPSWKNGWIPFLRNLKLVVVDELHVYSGWFGSNVAMIMRRLQRICERFLSNYDLKFVSCSATVCDPGGLMKKLFNLENVTVIDNDGAPSGNKRIIVCRTQLINAKDENSGRVHPIEESSQIIAELMSRGIRTIAFCKYRRTCELLMKAVRGLLKNTNLETKVMSYRSGYSPEDRRKIEKDLFEGNLLAIVATNALELGIDIGSLEAAVVVGFPFSISNLRQQFGRAGRSKKDGNSQSIGVLVCGGDPVDTHFASNPHKLLSLPNVDIGLNLDDNLLVIEPHIQCAAFESPLELTQDEKYFGALPKELLKHLLPESESSSLLVCDDKYLPWPANHVSIRGRDEDDEYAVVDITDGRNVVIEQVEASRVSFTLYEGGIFLHQGYPYLVKEVDLDLKFAKVLRVNVNWTTRQRDYTDVDPIETISLHHDTYSVAKIGKIKRTTIVFGFFKFDQRNRIIESVPVEHPPLIQISEGMWIDMPTPLFDFLKAQHLSVAGAIHGACHVFISMSSTVVDGGVGMGTECKAPEKEFAGTKSERTRPARLIFYDYFGNGICRKAFGFVSEILNRARERVSACPCRIGCPECIAMESCKEDSLVISKPGALAILNWFTGYPLDDIPVGPEENLVGKVIHESVVPVV